MKKLVFLVLTLTQLSTLALFGSDEKNQTFNETSALLENEKNTISVFENNAKAVVNVSTVRRAMVGSFFDYDVMEVPSGMGTGFIWNDDGHIVTNFHVIANGGTVYVAFKDDTKQYKAKVVGTEPRKDIAVLKLIEKPSYKIHPVKIGSSKKLKVGQKAMAIGNPFGLDQTITSGIVSALGRKVQGIGDIEIHGMIQADASINPGNSGGPLLNSMGEVIGVNTMIFSSSGSSAGVGFAVPIDTVKRIVPDIIKYGKFQQPGIGIEPLDYRLTHHLEIEKGLVIKSVTPDGPADKAGLKGMIFKRDRYKLGDIITKVDGRAVNSLDDILNILYDHKIGDEVDVTYLRGDKEKTTSLKLMNLTKAR